MAPNTGAASATRMPAVPSARPHCAVPTSGVAAIAWVKYVEKMKVPITVGKAELAQSYRHQEKTARLLAGGLSVVASALCGALAIARPPGPTLRPTHASTGSA